MNWSAARDGQQLLEAPHGLHGSYPESLLIDLL